MESTKGFFRGSSVINGISFKFLEIRPFNLEISSNLYNFVTQTQLGSGTWKSHQNPSIWPLKPRCSCLKHARNSLCFPEFLFKHFLQPLCSGHSIILKHLSMFGNLGSENNLKKTGQKIGALKNLGCVAFNLAGFFKIFAGASTVGHSTKKNWQMWTQRFVGILPPRKFDGRCSPNFNSALI